MRRAFLLPVSSVTIRQSFDCAESTKMEFTEMHEKDAPLFAEWFKQCLPYLSTLVLSCWGGTVAYLQRIRIKSHKFSFKELSFDLITSSFAGLLTYFFCEYAKLGGEMSAILIAVSGHMGTRAIAGFERIRDTIFGNVVQSNGGEHGANEKP